MLINSKLVNWNYEPRRNKQISVLQIESNSIERLKHEFIYHLNISNEQCEWFDAEAEVHACYSIALYQA